MIGSTSTSTDRDSGKRSGQSTPDLPCGGPGELAWLPQHLREAVQSLLNAYRYAQHVRDDLWHFGVELESLHLSLTDARWLLRAGYVDCAVEVTLPGELERSFRQCIRLTATESICLVLTKEGVEFAQELERRAVAGPAHPQERESHGPAANGAPAFINGTPKPGIPTANGTACRPKWDRNRQELRMGKAVVKRFKAPAHNQETVLAAFEEEQWPDRIDDPLPPVPELEPKRRLHDTINSLNRNQKHALIRFLGDGSGQGVLWEPVEPSLRDKQNGAPRSS